MLKIFVSGKPSNYEAAPESGEATQWGARFTLTEYRWENGAGRHVEHNVFVPQHSATYAKKLVDKGFTIVVEGDTLFANDPYSKVGETGGFQLGAVKLHNL